MASQARQHDGAAHRQPRDVGELVQRHGQRRIEGGDVAGARLTAHVAAPGEMAAGNEEGAIFVFGPRSVQSGF